MRALIGYAYAPWLYVHFFRSRTIRRSSLNHFSFLPPPHPLKYLFSLKITGILTDAGRTHLIAAKEKRKTIFLLWNKKSRRLSLVLYCMYVLHTVIQVIYLFFNKIIFPNIIILRMTYCISCITDEASYVRRKIAKLQTLVSIVSF